MRTSVVADAVIFTGRSDLQKIAAEQCKMKGVSNIVTPTIAEECVEALERFPKALLIIDWKIGPTAVAKVLGKDRKALQGESRPILLVADDVSQNLIAIAAEYNVSQIYTEQIQAKTLAGRLTALLLGETMPSDFKKLMADVAESRDAGDHESAAKLLKAAVAKNPTNMRLKAELAESLIMVEEAEEALKTLVTLDTAKPPYLRGIHMRGRALMKLGRFDDAAKAYESANLLNPNDVERLIELGNALLQADQREGAKENFERALAIDPENKPAKVGVGTVKLVDGQVNEALAILRDISGDLELASIFNTSAVLNMRAKRHDSGMQLYQAALKALGKDQRIQARLYFNMGIGYRRWGKKDQAQSCFETAVKLDPQYSKAKTQLTAITGGAPAPVTAPGAHEKLGKPQAVPQNKAAGADASGLLDFVTDFSDFGGDDDDQEESLFD